MKMKIITIGKPKKEFEGLFNEYLKRLLGFCSMQTVHLKEGKNNDAQILDEIDGFYSVFLDEKGKQFSSVKFSEFLEKKKNEGNSNFAFVIGGPDGHSEEVKKKADLVWSLSELTFPHDLAMVMLVEGLYRAVTIGAGHPYHRS